MFILRTSVKREMFIKRILCSILLRAKCYAEKEERALSKKKPAKKKREEEEPEEEEPEEEEPEEEEW
jgi:hypothetical protein